MFSRFTNALYNAVDALAPPLPLQEDFSWHWKAVTRFFTSKNASNKIPIESTRIPGHLQEMLSILEQEQRELEPGNIGPCMEFIMQHKLLDTMCILGASDSPPGMKCYMLTFMTHMLKLTPQFLIPHASIYIPITNFIKLCGEVLAAPTEKEEIEFLEIVCEKLTENPHLVNCFMGPFNDTPRRNSTNSEKQTLRNPNRESEKNCYSGSATVNKEYTLISSLLKLFCSPDNQMSIRASKCLKTCCSVANDSAAITIAQCTDLSQVMCKRIVSFYNCVSKKMKLSDIEEMVQCVSEEEDVSPNCPKMSSERRKFLCYLQHLHFIDTIVQQAHPIIGDDLCNWFHTEFLNSVVNQDLVVSENPDVHLFVTTMISSSVRHISSPKLISTYGLYLLGEIGCFEIAGHTSHMVKDILIERCRNTNKNLALSMSTLQLFEELLLRPTPFILNNLILSYLDNRGYYDYSAADSYLSISDDEDSLSRLSNDEDQASRSPVSRTFAPPYIHKILDAFLSLVPEEIQSCESEEDCGYDTYLKEAHNRFLRCLVLCEDFDWPQDPLSMEDSHLGAEDDSSSESQPEADSVRWQFYEGPFLSMVFDKIEHMLKSPYDINLQITALVSRLALFAHPNLHEYLLNPLIPHSSGTRFLFSVLLKLIENIYKEVKDIKSFRKKLQLTRKALLSDGNEFEPFEESNVLEVLIVVEEFCKELAAIAFVKYNAAS